MLLTLTNTIQEPVSSSLLHGIIYKDKILSIDVEESILYGYVWSRFLDYKTYGNHPYSSLLRANPYTGEYLSSIKYNGYTIPRDFILHVSRIFVNTYPL